LASLIASTFYDSADFDGDAFEESNLMHSLNGHLVCTQPPLVAPLLQRTRWYVGVIGTEVDMHTAHVHANTWLLNNHRTDAIQLLPRALVTADMVPDNVGHWLFHCHVTDHMAAGMMTTYTVPPPQSQLDQAAASDPHAHHATASDFSFSSTTMPAESTVLYQGIHVPRHLASQINGQVRRYYMAAEEVMDWNFTSQAGYELCLNAGGAHLPDGVPQEPATLPRARYIEYTDATFTTKKPRAAEWEHLGILGPVIRGQVGDILQVTFLNRVGRPFSVHPHGVVYPKNSEGAPYEDGTSGYDKHDDAVPQGENHTYTWFVAESSGPGPIDGDSIVWLYHAHVHEVEDENVGLIGSIVITARGKATSPTNLRPQAYDREFLVLFKVFEPVEMLPNVSDGTSGGAGHSHRQRQLGGGAAAELVEHPLMPTINGKTYCGITGLEMNEGDRVRWYFVSLGNEIDVHHASLTGHSFSWMGHKVSGVPLIAGTMHQADMIAGPAGTYLLFDGSMELLGGGTQAGVVIHPFVPGNGRVAPAPLPSAPFQTPARSYFVSADEVDWSYIAIEGADMCLPPEARDHSAAFAPENGDSNNSTSHFDDANTDLNNFPEGGRIFIRRDGNFLGHTYRKALYRAYTDLTFNTLVNNSDPASSSSTPALRGGAASQLDGGASDEHLGTLGPILRGAVGEIVRVVFRNNLQDLGREVNLVPLHALRVVSARAWNSTLNSWISIEGRSGDLDLAHQPVRVGEIVEYLIYIPSTAAPGPLDPSTIAWPYASTVDIVGDLYAGLMGAWIVAANPQQLADPGVDREFVMAVMIYNENLSPYLDSNIARFAENASAVDVADPEFEESNLLHAINGKVFCGLPGLEATKGEKVRWHLLGFGGALDIHTPTFHGGSVTRDGTYRPTIDLWPGMAASVDQVAETAGSFSTECGVNDHWLAGMRAIFQVDPVSGA